MMKTDTSPGKIDKILDRGIISEILPSKKKFRDAMLSGVSLRFYIGADPTSSSLHLSHAKNFMLLEEFRLLGHEVVVLFGDFTARIGDPTDRSVARAQLTKKEVDKNASSWKKQISPLMNFNDSDNPPIIKYNNEWLSKLDLANVVELSSNFTVQQMLERDMFKRRVNDEKPIFLHEFLYPLMQGYDSVAMDVDVELCGTDQTFNALAGRTLMKKLKGKDKFIVTVNLMENPKTRELMSKSKGTGVFLDVTPSEFYGSIMAQPDEMVEVMLINNTRLPLGEIKELVSGSPLDAKTKTALEITSMLHGKKVALEAQNEFKRVFSNKELPQDILEISVPKNGLFLDELLAKSGLVSSKTEVRRLIDQNGIKIENETAKNSRQIIEKGKTIKIGARRFLKTV